MGPLPRVARASPIGIVKPGLSKELRRWAARVSGSPLTHSLTGRDRSSMVGRWRAAIPIVLALAALVAGPTLAAADSERGGGGLAALSAIVETLQINGIEPLVRSPVAGGDEPFSVALVPVDSDAAQAAAAAWNLRRLQPTEGGVRQETMILPRQRPARADEAEARELAPTPPKATPVTATSDAYRKYIADLTYIAKLRLDDPKNLRRAQQLLVNHSLISLARAWIAQSSEIAARTQDFMSGVDKAADKNGGPDSLKSTISKQPFMVLDFAGWQIASLAIRKDLARDLALMASLAWRFSEIAYGRAGGEVRYAQEANKGNLTAAAPAGSPSPASVSSSPQLSDRAKPLMT